MKPLNHFQPLPCLSKLVILIGAVFVSLLGARAATVRYDLTAADSRDIYIRSSVAGTPFDTFQLRVGGWGDTYETLVRFPAETLPANATQVRLFLYCYGHSAGSGGASVAMNLHRVTSDWTNATTWNSQPTATAIGPLPAAVAGSWYAVDITAQYNLWKSGTPNYGIKLTPQGTNNQWNEFYSTDHTDPSLRPYVLVDYPDPPGTNTHRAALVRASSQYFTAPDSPSLSITNAITIEAWVKVDALDGTNQSIVGKGRSPSGTGYALMVTGLNKFNLSIWTGTATNVSSTMTPAANTWYHVAGTWDGATARIYVNGILDNSASFTGAIADSTEPLYIGKELTNEPQRFFGGNVDDVRLWSVTRSQAQLRAAMFSELIGTESGLKGYWKLNNSLADSSGNANTLTFQDGSLKAHYHLEDTNDSSGNGYTVANNGGVAFNAGRFGNAADFGTANGSKYLSTSDDLGGSLFNGSCSWSVWFSPSAQPATNGTSEIFGMATYSGAAERGYRIEYIDVAGVKKIQWIRGNYGGTDSILAHSGSLATGTWHHIALLYDAPSNTVLGYLDGVQVVAGVGYNNASAGGSNRKLTIGSWVTPTLYTSGRIDELAVFNRALAPQEVATLAMQAYVPGTFAFATSDLPFATAANQLEWCPDKDAKALWHLNGNASDSSASANHGTANAITFGPANGRFGEGAGFNGTSSYIDMTSVPIVGTDISMSFGCWFKTTSSARQSLIQFGDINTTKDFPQLEIGAIAPGQLTLDFAGFVGVRPTATFHDGQWHFVVVTVNGGTTVRLYVDGIELGLNTTTGLRVSNTGTVYKQIGRSQGGSNYFNGSIDEVFVTSRVLLAEEVMKYYGGIVSARFAALSGDGSVVSIGASDWSAARNAPGTSGGASASFGNVATRQGGIAGNRGNSGSDFVERGFFPFDTSPLPDSGVAIAHAVLNVVPTIVTECPFYITPQTQASVTSLTLADFGAVTLNSSPLFSELLSPPPLNNYSSLPLNGTGRSAISLTGPTRLGTRSVYDVNNTGEGGVETNTGATFSESPTNKPFLLVEYAQSAVAARSIAGTISGVSLPPGTIRVTASSTTTPAIATTTLASPGVYTIPGLPLGESYNVTAYIDANGNNTKDPIEWSGSYASNPVALTADRTGINITLTDPFAIDTDGDGLPDAWELAYGLIVGVNDALLDKDGDGLNNAQEFWLGLLPNNTDTDGDGLSDSVEVNIWGTNPLLTDTDTDGLPDAWEANNGLDPRRDDANEDRDFDFLTNAQEYNGGINSTNPNNSDTDGNGVSDYAQKFAGQNQWEALYDRTDRLLGIRHARGASFAQSYDGNSNLTRQIKLGLDTDHDGLSDVWEFSHGLNPNSANGLNGPTGDSDSDGWTNLQEQVGGSDPKAATSKPGADGTVIGALSVPFTPTNFISASGQLDNAGAEEFVVGPDGNPGAQNNAIRVFTERAGSWTSALVSVGSYGVTSAAIGQLPNRRAAIYLGLWKTGGFGRVVELVKDDLGAWQTNVVAQCTGEAAFVTGIRTAGTATELVFRAAMRFGTAGALYRASFEEGVWKVALLDAQTSNRDAGLVIKSGSSDRIARLLDTGGIQFNDPKPSLPSLDEFADTSDTIPSAMWDLSGSGTSGHSGTSQSVQETGGSLRLTATWSSGSGLRSASAVAVTGSLWSNGGQGLLIRIEAANRPQSSSGAYIQIGGQTVFDVPSVGSLQDVLVQVIRVDQTICWRRRTGAGPWEQWAAQTISPFPSSLRLEASGNDTQGSGTAYLYIDYIRYMSPSELVLSGASSTDFPASVATSSAYRAATNTWYFTTPAAASWPQSHLDARARYGTLTTIDSTETNGWLQSKFNGEFWTGYHRDLASTPWKWVSGATSTPVPVPWVGGQTPTAPDHFFAFSNGGIWSSGTGAESKLGVFELKSPLVEVVASTENEPASTNRLQSRGRNLALGRFNSASGNQQSLVEAFIEDTAPLGVVNAGDEFVVAELVLGSSPLVQRTLARRALTGTALAGSYGFAAVRTRAGTSDFLATAENDGQVFAWLPPTPGTALQRKTLSVAHAGKAWHSLERVRMTGGADGLAGVRVTPGTPQTADVVFWSPYDLGFTTPPIIQQSLPSARISSTPASGTSHSRVDVKLWDSEGNLSQVALQYQSPPGTGPWTNAALLTIAGQPAASNPALPAPPTGAMHTLLWNAVQDLGPAFNSGVLLHARAADNSGTGAWSEPMFYTVNVTGDFDGDGMTDGWEIANNLNPNDPGDAGTDKDNDGTSNLAEFVAGTNPVNAASVMRITNISRSGSVVTLTWSSVPGKSYVIQSAPSAGGAWSDVSGTAVTASSLTQSLPVTGVAGNRAFYRVRIGP